MRPRAIVHFRSKQITISLSLCLCGGLAVSDAMWLQLRSDGVLRNGRSLQVHILPIYNHVFFSCALLSRLDGAMMIIWLLLNIENRLAHFALTPQTHTHRSQHFYETINGERARARGFNQNMCGMILVHSAPFGEFSWVMW